MRAVVVAILSSLALLVAHADTASSHGYRHGKNLTAGQIKTHPSWLMAPGHICNRDFQGDIAVTYDDELGWVVIWKCTCILNPNGITYTCWWRPMRVLPENVSNRIILREIREVMAGRSYGRIYWRNLPGGVVFRRHAIDNHCHWHNPKPRMVIWASKL
jgi:hypothetical protein